MVVVVVVVVVAVLEKECSCQQTLRDVFDHGSRKNLHHFHDFFHNRGTAEATRGVTTLEHGRRADLHTVHDLFHNQRTGWRDTKIFVSLSARVERE